MANDTTGKPTRSKKSETLEVRIPYDTKQAFLTACREDGTTASEVVRESVQIYLDERERPPPQEKRTLIMKFPEPVRRYGPRVAVGGLAALGFVTLAALPSAADPDIRVQFNRLDANKDGVLSSDEFLGVKDADSKDEDVVVETRTVTRNSTGDAPPPRPEWTTPGLKQDAFSFWMPDELAGNRPGDSQEFRFVSRSEVKTLQDGEQAPSFTFNVEDFRKKEFESIDANSDGRVTMAEYAGRQTAMLTRGFELLDANSDKSLTLAEYSMIVSPPIRRQGGDLPHVIDLGRHKPLQSAIDAAFARLDTNKDKKLSLQEYLPPS